MSTLESVLTNIQQELAKAKSEEERKALQSKIDFISNIASKYEDDK